MTSTAFDIPAQMNAADEQQVAEAGRRERLGEKQDVADSYAEIENTHGRRRCWPIVKAVLTEAVRPQASDEACREYAVEQRLLKYRVVQWMQHRELFVQLIDEGLRRDAELAQANAARRMKRST